MILSSFVYYLPYLISLIMTISVTAYAAFRHRTPDARALAFMTVLESLYISFFALEITTSVIDEKIFLDTIQWGIVFLIPLATLQLATRITDLRIKRRDWIVLILITGALTGAVITNPLHGWFYASYWTVPAMPVDALYYPYAPLAWFAIIFGYGIVIIVAVQIAHYTIRVQTPRSRRLRFLLAGLLLPSILSAVLTVLDIDIVGHRDTIPVFFGVSNLIIAYSMFRHRLFHVVPAAHDLVIENMPDAVVVLSNEYEILGMNASARTRISAQTASFLGVPVEQMFPEWGNTIRSRGLEQEFEIELEHLHPDGSQSISDLRGKPVIDPDGHVEAYMLIARDVTELRRVEQFQRQLELIFEQSSSSILIADVHGRIEYVNPKFTQVTGYGLEEIRGKNPNILQSGMTPPETFEQLWSTLLSGQAWQGEFTNRKKNGEIYRELAKISPVRDKQGKVTHYVGIKDDITEQLEMRKNLMIAEHRYRSLYEQSTDAVFILSLDGQFMDTNHRSADMLGYERDELLGKSFRDVVAPPEQGQSTNVLQRLLNGEHLPVYERTFRHKDGREFPVEINVELIRDYKGNPLHIQSIARDITARKKTEQELLLTKERLELALWGGEVGLWDMDFQQNSVFYNEQWARMLDYTLAELEPINTAWDRLIHPNDHQAIQRVLREHIEQNTPYFELIYRMRSKSGEWKYILDRGKVLGVDENGNYLRAIGTHMDITEAETIRRQLKDSEERHRLMIGSLHSGIVMFDASGKILTCNLAAGQILGVEPVQVHRDELMPINWQAIREDGSEFPIDERPFFRALLTGQSVRDVTIGFNRPDHKLIWLLMNAEPLFRPGESSPYAVIVSFSDVTEQRKAQEALRQSEARFSQAFQNSPVPMVISTIDVDNPIYIDVNDAYCDLTGYTREELIGHSMTKLGIAIPNVERDQRLMTLDQERQYRMKEGLMQNRNGQIRNILISAQRVKINGEFLDIEILLDVTERKKAEQQALSLSLERERIRFITHFIRSASHEFRTPLSIIGTSVYLLSRMADPERTRPQVERVENQVKRVIRLLDMLLLLAHLDSGNPIARKQVLLTTLIEQGETGIYLEKNAKNLQVIATYPPEPLYTLGDPDYLRQMLYFLLENAVRFTPRNGTLTLRLTVEHPYALIEVKDTGIGISQDSMSYIFEPFWRQDEARTESGFGLGLPISRRIAEQHGGSIELSSILNEGTTVLVRLPLVVPQEKSDDGDTLTTAHE